LVISAYTFVICSLKINQSHYTLMLEKIPRMRRLVVVVVVTVVVVVEVVRVVIVAVTVVVM